MQAMDLQYLRALACLAKPPQLPFRNACKQVCFCNAQVDLLLVAVIIPYTCTCSFHVGGGLSCPAAHADTYAEHSDCSCDLAGDPDIVGVLAELATVDDARLSEVLAVNYRSLLPVVVVKTHDCITRLAQHLQQQQMPRPDILSLSHSQPYK